MFMKTNVYKVLGFLVLAASIALAFQNCAAGSGASATASGQVAITVKGVGRN